MCLEAASRARLSDFWTWPGWTPLGVLFAAAAAAGAILAWTQSKRSQDIADKRYQQDITPRPHLIFVRDRNLPVEFEADVLNAGGAAVATLFLVQIRKAMVAGGIALPSHGTAQMQLTHRVNIQHDQYPATPVVIAALDIQGNWWNCGLGARIRELARLMEWRARSYETASDAARRGTGRLQLHHRDAGPFR